jgi:hypothetical protein
VGPKLSVFGMGSERARVGGWWWVMGRACGLGFGNGNGNCRGGLISSFGSGERSSAIAWGSQNEHFDFDLVVSGVMPIG